MRSQLFLSLKSPSHTDRCMLASSSESRQRVKPGTRGIIYCSLAEHIFGLLTLGSSSAVYNSMSSALCLFNSALKLWKFKTSELVRNDPQSDSPSFSGTQNSTDVIKCMAEIVLVKLSGLNQCSSGYLITEAKLCLNRGTHTKLTMFCRVNVWPPGSGFLW